MKKIIKCFFLFLLIFFISDVNAKEINIDFFYGNGCPICSKEEKFLEEIEKKYDVKINKYETWYNEENAKLLDEIKEKYNTTGRGVPYTVVEDNAFLGFNTTISSQIEDKIKELNNNTIKDDKTPPEDSKTIYDIPIIGKVDIKKVSVLLITIVIGLVDGFNPCAMWVLLFLISSLLGMKDRKRIDECIKFGIVDTIIVSLMITLLFELLAHPLSQLFGLSGSTQEMIDICSTALHIASLGFVFMGISVAIQGVLQSIGYAIRPLIIALLRLVIFVFPIAYFFTLTENVTTLVWWTFPISELLTVIVSLIILKKSYNERISPIKNESITNNLVIAISREHGTNGKEIARQVAKELNIEFYDKERIKEFALKHGFVSNKESEDYIYSQFLSLDINKNSIILLSNVIKEIAKKGNCVIVGRAADYILKEDEKLVRIFLYAPLEYRLNKVMEIYHDSHEDALRYIHKSDHSRKSYYEVISNKIWGDKSNYDLCLDCKLGNETIKDIICNYVKSLNK